MSKALIDAGEQSMMDGGPASPGRPRNPEIDARVIAATRALLAEEGFAATTILAVSRMSEIRPASIYRRWPSRIELIEEAIFPGMDSIAIEPTGDLRADLERFVRGYKASFSSPVAIAALPGLIAEYYALPPDQRTSAPRMAIGAARVLRDFGRCTFGNGRSQFEP